MSNPSHHEPIEILLADDDAGDVRLTIEAFKHRARPRHVNVVSNGVEVLEFLRRQGKYADAARPDLILLDWNMPRKNGRDALAEIKSDPALRSTPVVIFTTSELEQDILTSYQLSANSFVTKPVQFEQFHQVVRSIDEYWFTTVKLPQP
jgi:two-component system, chemotaxis family, response regulator Rcp1